jgi:pyridoxal 5'-phosphate synthase pdxT subunit
VADTYSGFVAGVLALQGDFAAHAQALTRLGAEAREVRRPADLAGIDCLCMPGGESTTMSLLLDTSGLRAPLREALLPKVAGVLATCAGAILLAARLGNDSGSRKVEPLGLLDATLERNAYGRQVDSFEAELRPDWPKLDCPPEWAERPLRGVFIRAPLIREPGPGVALVCSRLDGEIVMVRQGGIIAATFHPELSDDTRVHEALLRTARHGW